MGFPYALARPNYATRSFAERGCSRINSLRRRCILLLLFLGILPRLVDFLHHAAGVTARPDRRTGARTGIADSHDLLRLLRPGLALLARALRILRLGQPITLALRRANADILPRARIIAVNRNRCLSGLSQRSCRHSRNASGESRSAGNNDHQPIHVRRVLSRVSAARTAVRSSNSL